MAGPQRASQTLNTRGQAAEALAAAFLEQNGLRIVARNYRTRHGEIDLIAHDHNMLVFIEVRARSSDAFGGAAASITAAKREKLLLAARQYLAGNRNPPACRFDALLVNGKTQEIEWIRDAFGE